MTDQSSVPPPVKGNVGDSVQLLPGQVAELELAFQNPSSDLRDFEIVLDVPPSLRVSVDEKKRRVKANGRANFLVTVSASSESVAPGDYSFVAAIMSHNLPIRPPGDLTTKVKLLPPPLVEEVKDTDDGDQGGQETDGGSGQQEENVAPGTGSGTGTGGATGEDKSNDQNPGKNGSTGNGNAGGRWAGGGFFGGRVGGGASQNGSGRTQVSGAGSQGGHNHGGVAGGVGGPKQSQDTDGTPPFVEATKTEFDLADDKAIDLRPGQTCLLHYEFRNRERGTVVYDINVELLDPKWFDIIQTQVDIRPGGRHYVSALIKVPEHAQPKTQVFKVRVGPVQTDERTSPRPADSKGIERRYRLRVLSTSAVALTADSAEKTGKATDKAIEFQLFVRNVGNASTAYRLAVREEKSENGKKLLGPPIQKKEEWSYELDKELENSMLPTPSDHGEPVQHRLRVRPTRPWYWGTKQSHTLAVVAEPVTDVENGSREGNSIQLIAVRKRIFPIAWFIWAPLLGVVLFFFFLLGLGLSDLEVVSEIPGTNHAGIAFAVPPVADHFTDSKGETSVPISLRWHSSPFLLLIPKRIIIDGESHFVWGNETTVQAKIAAGKYTNPNVNIDLASTFGIVKDSRKMVVLPHRTSEAFAYAFDGYSTAEDIQRAAKAGVLSVGKDLRVSGEAEPRETVDITLTTKQDGTASITLKNKSDGYQIYYWFAKAPSGYEIYNASADDELQLKNRGDGEEATTHEIRFIPHKDGDLPAREEHAMILTTDNNAPILRLTIRRPR